MSYILLFKRWCKRVPIITVLLQIKQLHLPHQLNIPLRFILIPTQMQCSMKNNPEQLFLERNAKCGSIFSHTIDADVNLSFNAGRAGEVKSDDISVKIMIKELSIDA